jgi:hypothetical protein
MRAGKGSPPSACLRPALPIRMDSDWPIGWSATAMALQHWR